MKQQQMKTRVRGNVIMPEQAVPLDRDRSNVSRIGIKEVNRFKSLAEKLAKDSLYYKNHYFSGGKEAFPLHPAKQTVSKFFPYADGGPLYIDEADRTDDKDVFIEKQSVMEKLGHRYVAILPGMTELDCLERIA